MATVKSAADIANGMVAAMKVADPELDTAIGSVSRKIFDVVAEQVAPAWAIGYLQDWAYSIESKSGSALDDFVNGYGIHRISARRATGRVTFTRPSVATSNVAIPAGTFVMTATLPRVVFRTVAGSWLLKDTKEVSVPVQAVNPGATGNLPVGSITVLTTGLSGVSSRVVQADAMTGGTDAESDEALRERFRKTVFRSLAGTEDMFMGLALEDATPDDDTDATSTAAIVVGPTRHWREQVQVIDIGGGVLRAYSTFPVGNAKYIYPESVVLGRDIEAGSILTKGVHYSFTTGGSFGLPTVPHVTSVDEGLEEGALYELDFEYVSIASRNDPTSGITNRVDVWVAGSAPEPASEVTYWQPQTLSAISTDPLYVGNFIRHPKVQAPVAGNKFLQLAWGPVVEFPDMLTVDGQEYVNGVDFWVIHDISATGLSPRSRFGLEFTAATVPEVGARITLSDTTGYFYNRLPAEIEARVRRWRLVGSDVMVHQGFEIRIILNLAVMYAANYERGVVQSGIDAALSAYFNTLPFGATLQVSDMLSIVHSVPGVDNVRFLNSSEPAIEGAPSTWGAQWVAPDGTHVLNLGTTGGSPNRVKDIVLADYQIPVLYDVRYVTKAQNTYNEA